MRTAFRNDRSAYRVLIGLALLTGRSLWASGPDTPDLVEIAGRLEEATLDLTASVDAAGLELPLDYGTLKLIDGSLSPVRVPGDERILEVLFLGQGTLVVDIDDEVERQQLTFFTGRDVLNGRIDRAILIQADGTLASRLAGRTLVELDAEDQNRARDLFREWTEDADREGFGTRSALIRALAGDPLGARYVGLWFDSRDLGRGYYEIDPRSKEPVGIGSYQLFDNEDFMTHRRKKLYRRLEKHKQAYVPEEEEEEKDCHVVESEWKEASERRAGEAFPWIQTWVSYPRPSADPTQEPSGFEPQHYEIDLTLTGNELQAEGTARIEMQANADGLTVASLRLGPQVNICEITDQHGRQLSFERRDWAVLVMLPEPSESGRPMEWTIHFAGEPIRHWSSRYNQRDTLLWHPHVGKIDRATYDVTLRWPSDMTLLASGKTVGGGIENGQRWTRRTLHTPTIGFSFEIGDYQVVEEQVGHIDLTFGFHSRDRDSTEEIRAETILMVKAAILMFEAELGRLPFDQMAVVTTTRGYSQGLLGFITLSEGGLTAAPDVLRDNRTSQEIRLSLIAHEVSHQWWGHMVGWDGYRDQWLSEGLADFSSLRFMGRLSQKPEIYQKKIAELWRASLQTQLLDGRRVGSLGPVVLGRRIRWNHGGAAYSRVVYEKGSACFSTLAERLGPEQLWKMLGTLSRAVNHRVIRTSSFFKAIERMSGQDLSGFLDQYVYGTGLPALFYDYRTLRTGDGWLIEGQVRQLPAPRFRYVLQPAGRAWDVVRQTHPEPDTDSWVNIVPFYYETGDGSARQGTLTIKGELSTFTIPTSVRPTSFQLDPRGTILGDWVPENAEPKQYWLRIGEHLARIGRREEAFATLARARSEPYRILSEGAASLPVDDAHSQELDARTHLIESRLHLDAGDADAARKSLRAAEKLVASDSDLYEGDRMVLAVRLDLRSGRFDSADDRLSEYLNKYSARLELTDVSAWLDQSGASALQISRGEVLALLAATARGRRDEDATLITRLAALAGVEMGLFTRRN